MLDNGDYHAFVSGGPGRQPLGYGWLRLAKVRLSPRSRHEPSDLSR